MSAETKTVMSAVRPRFEDDDSPYATSSVYVNYAEIASNDYEVRLTVGVLPMRTPPGAEEVLVPKVAELILPPVVAEQVAKLILANLGDRTALQQKSNG